MRLDTSIERLNNYIDRLQVDASPRTAAMGSGGDGEGTQPGGIEVAMLQMAAHLNSMRAQANVPDSRFIARLRSQVVAEVAGGTNLAR